jgi:twitching motility protein PilJ
MAVKLKLPSFSKTGLPGAGEKKISSIPLIGRVPFKQQLQLLGGGVVLSLLTSILAGVLDFRATSIGAHQLELSGQLVTLTQRVAKDAGSALQGNETAINGLPQARADVERILAALDSGDGEAPALGGASREVLEKLLPIANQQLGYVKEIEAGRSALDAITVVMNTGRKIIALLDSESGKLAGDRGGRIVQLGQSLERIDTEVGGLLSGAVIASDFDMLAARIAAAEALVAGLDQSNPAVEKILPLFVDYTKAVRAVVGAGKTWGTAKQGADKLFAGTSVTKNGPFYAASQELTGAVKASLAGRWTNYLLVASGLLLLAFMALLERAYLVDARIRAAEADAVNRRNQAAILRLMNELGDLGDGDLTVRATVTEDITGAIADSINYTAEELQKLVSRVVKAVEQMRKATGDAESYSKSLLEATQKQALEIQEAGDSVQLMSRSILEVDATASKAAEVGRHTLTTTEQGVQAVSNAISGMDGIREQIQETSKRIKRLGESSQEIGEIVDLISDITEQTNVLALNAAIQAVSAGEAGRGFSVVAEEVQRLAERSAEATKKISALVKTIQSDTHDAVAAMEKSTQGVVEGTKLSDMAGQSLKEIGQVSNELTTLITSISVSTQMQTDMAGEVAEAMKDILQITGQTTEGTRQTAQSVEQLNSIAAGLKDSVAGFKL